MVLSGTAHVTLAPGAPAEYAGAGSNVRGVARLSESAELTVDGGTFTELAHAGCSPSTAFGVDDSAKLLLDTVTFVDTPAQNRWGTVTVHDEGSVTILDSTFDGGAAPAVVADGPGTQIVNIERTTIRDLTGAAILLGRERAAGTPELTITNGVLTGNVHGIGVTTGGVGGINLTVPDITITDTEISGNTRAGIELNNGGCLSITGGELTGNGGGATARGAIFLQAPTRAWTLELRDVQVTGNTSGTNLAAILLTGTAATSFDLGTVSDPGQNELTGNTGTSIRVQTAAGVLVHAVGNTWEPSVQGADASGQYAAAGAGAAVDVTTGTGANYTMAPSSGTLRLAENP
jgi:hypothetical protein